MQMCALLNVIREKHNWWEKIKDPALVEKWTQEALNQQRGEYRIRQLTRRMVNTPRLPLTRVSPGSKIDYVFQELHGYAFIRDPETGIEVRWHLILLVLPHKRCFVRLDLTDVSGGQTP